MIDHSLEGYSHRERCRAPDKFGIMEIRCYVSSHTVEEGPLFLECEARPLQEKTSSSSGLHLRGNITPHGRQKIIGGVDVEATPASESADTLEGPNCSAVVPRVEALAAEEDQTGAVLQINTDTQNSRKRK